MKYLLDTDTCIHAMKRERGVLERLLATARAEVAVSALTEAELRTGAAKCAAPAATLRRIEAFLAPIAVLPFVADDARAHATIRARLERAGQPIGALDALIAAQALSRGLTLVTSNEREFRHVPRLKRANWATS